MQTISLFDTLVVSRTEGTGISLQIDGPQASGAPANSSNLVWRAAELLRGEAGLLLNLTKRIPVQAGLGGGSSDAAAALTAVNSLLGLGRSIEELVALGAQLGSDVPFFLTGGTAIVTAAGECVSGIASFYAQVVLVLPDARVSTRDAYAALDALDGRVSANATPGWPATGLANDFEAVIFGSVPAVAAAREALAAAGAHVVHLCGSGSALFGISDDPQKVAERVSARGVGQVWVCRTPASSIRYGCDRSGGRQNQRGNAGCQWSVEPCTGGANPWPDDARLRARRRQRCSLCQPGVSGGRCAQPEGVTLVAPGETLLDNLIRGIDAAGAGPDSMALMVSSDIPFITGLAIDDFVDAARTAAADFCYPVIPMERYNQEFAGMKRTTLKLSEEYLRAATSCS